MNPKEESIVRIGSAVIRAIGLFFFSSIPITIIMSIVPGGEDGFSKAVGHWYLWLGMISAAVEAITGALLWIYAKNISRFMCRDL